jgi:hypothetical protein
VPERVAQLDQTGPQLIRIPLLPDDRQGPPETADRTFEPAQCLGDLRQPNQQAASQYSVLIHQLDSHLQRLVHFGEPEPHGRDPKHAQRWPGSHQALLGVARSGSCGPAGG